MPDVDCHWYVVAPDNTFGEGFSWSNAPWFSAEGLLDIGNLKNTMGNIHEEAAAHV
ncbi:putative conserved secreted protein [Synechococcus sp. A15-24]|nr:putative conserved secreted protein [Synechococcus sp. A15-24]